VRWAPLCTIGSVRCPGWRLGPSGAPRAVACIYWTYNAFSSQFTVARERNTIKYIFPHQNESILFTCSSLPNALLPPYLHRASRARTLWAYIENEALAKEWLQRQDINIITARPTHGEIIRWGLADPGVKISAEVVATFLSSVDPPVSNVVIKSACGITWIETSGTTAAELIAKGVIFGGTTINFVRKNEGSATSSNIGFRISEEEGALLNYLFTLGGLGAVYAAGR